MSDGEGARSAAATLGRTSVDQIAAQLPTSNVGSNPILIADFLQEA